MRSFWLLLGAALVAGAIDFNAGSPSGVLWSAGCDWAGNDLSSVSGQGADCGRLCVQTQGCTHFSWTSWNSGTCWLKGAFSAPELKPTKEGICGYVILRAEATPGHDSYNPYLYARGHTPSAYANSLVPYMRSNPNLAPLASRLRTYPVAFWLDTLDALRKIEGVLDEAARAAAGGGNRYVEFVVYNLPGRDCKAFASAGELKKGEAGRYKRDYIDAMHSIFSRVIPRMPSNLHIVLIVEPDSLPNLATNIGTNQCDGTTAIEYPDCVSYAIAKLSGLPRTHLYLDAAHGGWLGWADGMKKATGVFKDVMFQALRINPFARIRGFASNVANYSPFISDACPARAKCPLFVTEDAGETTYDWNPCIDERRYTARFNAYLAAAGLPARWIVDTSRNGRAGVRGAWGSWCNVKGAGIGQRPTYTPTEGAGSNVDAFVWVKPPGESDGVAGPPGVARLDRFCNPNDVFGKDAMPGAPQAGVLFPDHLTWLLFLAVPAIEPLDPPPCVLDANTNPSCNGYWNRLEDLAIRYAPEFRFHPKEHIWPITPRDLYSHAKDISRIVNERPVRLRNGPITPSNLEPVAEGDRSGTIVRFEMINEDTPWVKRGSGEGADGSGAWTLTTIMQDLGDEVEFQYWMLYAYNRVEGMWLTNWDHATDLVVAAVRVRKSDGSAIRVWYAQHGGGRLFDWEKHRKRDGDEMEGRNVRFSVIGGTHPIVYISQGNHEHYPETGTFNCKAGGLVCTDHPKDGGFAWRPWERRSAFDFVRFSGKMNDQGNRDRYLVGEHRWLAFNAKISGYWRTYPPGSDELDSCDFDSPGSSGRCNPADLETGVSAVSFQPRIESYGDLTSHIEPLDDAPLPDFPGFETK